jgi:hypothetical protein
LLIKEKNMNGITVIAVILFVVLCPCVSYIIVKRWLIPWTGGICMIIGDINLLSVDWNKPQDWGIGAKSIVKGFFLPGARANMLPEVRVNPLPREQEEPIDLSYVIQEDSSGVYLMLNKPLSLSCTECFMLYVSAPNPWKGSKWSKRDSSGRTSFSNQISIYFDNREDVFGNA